MLTQFMDSLIWLLPNIGKQLIPVSPEKLLGLNSGTDAIQGVMGCFHALLSYGAIVHMHLEGLSIFALKHELELLPTLKAVMSLLSLKV